MSSVEASCRAVLHMDIDRFLKVLNIELEHVERHLQLMVDGYREKQVQREVTEHVCNENIAVLENEVCGLRRFAAIVDRLDPDDYGSIEEVISGIRERFRSAVESSGLAEATYVFANRKITKVARYAGASI